MKIKRIIVSKKSIECLCCLKKINKVALNESFVYDSLRVLKKDYRIDEALAVACSENNLLRCVIKVDVTSNAGFYSLNRDDVFTKSTISN